MIRVRPLMITAVIFLCACASFNERGRMENLQETVQAYEHALLRGDFTTAAGFMDPTVSQDNLNYDQFKKIKIVDCRPTRVVVADDKMSVKRDLELQYFLVDRNILRSTPYRQEWQYEGAAKKWTMKTGLPSFEQ